MKAQNKRTYLLLAATLACPILFFLSGLGINDELMSKIPLLFINKIAAQTTFPESARLYMLLMTILLPFQSCITARIVANTDPARFDRLIESLSKSKPIFQIGSKVLVDKKWEMGLFSSALFILIFAGIFLVGGDLHACKGCETAHPFVFMLVAAAGDASMIISMLLFFSWIKLLLLARR